MERLSVRSIRFHAMRALLIAVVAIAVPQSAFADERPNVVLILADDLGYGDLNLEIEGQEVFSNPQLSTPHLAQLAQQSLVLTSHYAASPVCSPSRAGLLTGRTPTRCGIDLFIDDQQEDNKVYLQGSEFTIAEMLKSQGYSTGIFGKWHLNGADWEVPSNWTGTTGSFPRQQGFESGIVTKENPHYTRQLAANTQKTPGDFFSVEGEPLGPLKGYTSDIISRHAIDWMQEQSKSNKPFFAFLSYDAVHFRIDAADRFDEKYNTGNARRDAYYANVSHLDHAIGTVIDALDRSNLRKNTLIIFSSDNGPAAETTWHPSAFCYGTAFPLLGAKLQLQEGGIRVPGLVCWPEKIARGISDEPNSTLDLLPTLAELSGATLPADRLYDGSSLLQQWFNPSKSVERKVPLYWQFEYSHSNVKNVGENYLRRVQASKSKHSGVMMSRVKTRRGNFVLVGEGTEMFEPPTNFELYDLSSDIEQQRDLYESLPKVASTMKSEMLQMHADVLKDRKLTLETRSRNVHEKINTK